MLESPCSRGNSCYLEEIDQPRRGPAGPALDDLWADADPEFQPRVAAARTRAEEIVRARG